MAPPLWVARICIEKWAKLRHGPCFASWASGFRLEIIWYWAKIGTKFEWRPFFFVCFFALHLILGENWDEMWVMIFFFLFIWFWAKIGTKFKWGPFFFLCSAPDVGQKLGRNLSVTISNSDLCSSQIFWSFWAPPFSKSCVRYCYQYKKWYLSGKFCKFTVKNKKAILWTRAANSNLNPKKSVVLPNSRKQRWLQFESG